MTEEVEWRRKTDNRLEKLEICSESMMDAIAGKEIFGGNRDGGLVSDMKWVKDQLQNGNLHAKLVTKDRVALWCAAIGAIGIVIAAAFGAFA